MKRDVLRVGVFRSMLMPTVALATCLLCSGADKSTDPSADAALLQITSIINRDAAEVEAYNDASRLNLAHLEYYLAELKGQTADLRSKAADVKLAESKVLADRAKGLHPHDPCYAFVGDSVAFSDCTTNKLLTDLERLTAGCDCAAFIVHKHNVEHPEDLWVELYDLAELMAGKATADRMVKAKQCAERGGKY